MLDYIISPRHTPPHPISLSQQVLQAVWTGVSYLLCHLPTVFPFQDIAKLEYSQRLPWFQSGKVFADTLLE